ncbi:MAG: hypothetical protein EOP00_26840 [Pedobacter sp.]|nr:MAG: hypothetical protein EOP00_26840 [Pedobacter sp.]
MENSPQNQPKDKDKATEAKKAKVKTNEYTPEEKKFADGEGTKLDEAIDGDAANPATRGD